MRDLLTQELPRAEYMPNPEGFLSALAWSEYQVERENAETERIRYRKLQDANSVKLIESEPAPDQHPFLQDALHKNGFQSARKGTDEARAVLNSVLGMHIRNAKSQPASPLTPSLALMQNMRGATSKPSPANYSLILETIFAYGSQGENEETVSSLWRHAADQQLELSPLLRVIDVAFQDPTVSILGPRSLREADSQDKLGIPVRRGIELFRASPMGWFNRNWTRISSPEWVAALPSRVWVDWATTVIRTAFGFSYLWEATLYQRIAEMAINNEPDRIEALASDCLSLTDWGDKGEGIQSRDVASTLKWRVMNGQGLRDAINEFFDDRNLLDVDPVDAMRALAADSKTIDHLYSLKQSRVETGSGKLRWEVVSHSLTARETTAEYADHYGFLRKVPNSRFTIVDPATEWVVATASLACGRPSASSNLGNYLEELRELGLEPAVAEMVERLERSGIARGSADADLGLEIKAAF